MATSTATTTSTQFVSIKECARIYGWNRNTLWYHIQAHPERYTQLRVGNSMGVIPAQFQEYAQIKRSRK